MPEPLQSSTMQTTTSIPPSSILLAKLAVLRRRRLVVEAGTGTALAVLICLELLALLLFADWWLDFAWGVRAMLFVLQLAVFNAILYRYVFKPQFRPPDDEELALQVEKAHP